MQNNYTDILTEMGLSVNEAKVYLALLKKNSSQAAELAVLSGVPQKMIYYVLQKLMSKGLCTLLPGKVKKYKPIDPGSGIGELITQSEQKIEMTKNMVVELKKQYKDGQNETKPLEFIEVIQNPIQIAEKMVSLERMAKEEVLSFNKRPYAMARRNVEEIGGLEKGIKYRSIYETDEARKLISRSVIEMYMKAGEEVRVVPELPMKMMIFDNNVLMFTLESSIVSRTNLTAMIIENSDIVKTMKETFNMYWQKAMTLEELKAMTLEEFTKEKIS